MTSPRIGLVLGGGGAAGLAFHAGALLALQHDLGWDPRTAEVVVGTSAGSIIAALLRSGLDTDDLAAWGTEAAARPGRHHLRAFLDDVTATRLRVKMPSVRRAVPSPRILGAAFGRQIGVTSALISQLPFGVVDASTAIEKFGLLHEEWPEPPTWITTTRVRDGALTVFGRDDTASVGSAVAASCAIPGLYRPVRIGAHHYVDGGVHSPTNADVLSAAQVDVAVVLAPMSQRQSGSSLRPDRRLRRHFARTLQRERTALEASGVACQVIEPDEATVEAMGINLLDRRRTTGVIRSAFLGVGPQLDEGVRAALTA